MHATQNKLNHKLSRIYMYTSIDLQATLPVASPIHILTLQPGHGRRILYFIKIAVQHSPRVRERRGNTLCNTLCDVESTSLTLIQRRNNVVCPADSLYLLQWWIKALCRLGPQYELLGNLGVVVYSGDAVLRAVLWLTIRKGQTKWPDLH